MKTKPILDRLLKKGKRKTITRVLVLPRKMEILKTQKPIISTELSMNNGQPQ